MKILNTISRKLEELVSLEDGRISMYTCGPTVYDFAHIGNYRAYMFEDILRRHLKWSGFEVVQVQNLTDVDDKTIRGAREAGVSLSEYTKKYVDAFFEDLKVLGIEAAEYYPAATNHIEEMKDLIQKLFDNGYAYKSEDGSVYYDVGKFENYGQLAHIDTSELRSGARVAQDEYEKENVADFALWKAWSEEDGDVAWESPWGKGRPGWHIECSAMGMKYLGESFDIHTGGVDNIFPHHENEIAQSEGATGKPFVKYWMHCAHLQVEGQKMSKSLGNFYTLRDILDKGFSGREVRYVLISGHYRQTLNFTFDALSAARSSLRRVDEFKVRLQEVVSDDTEAGPLPGWAAKTREKFKAALDDDLNVAEALGEVFTLVHAGNKAMDDGNCSAVEAAAVLQLLSDFDNVLGVFAKTEEKPDNNVLSLLNDRNAAREAKDWGASDRIRDELSDIGWDVKDTPDGQKLRRK